MRATLGTLLLVLLCLKLLGVIDLRVCVGAPGSCSAAPTIKPLVTA